MGHYVLRFWGPKNKCAAHYKIENAVRHFLQGIQRCSTGFRKASESLENFSIRWLRAGSFLDAILPLRYP
jgi:hypothetical protein